MLVNQAANGSAFALSASLPAAGWYTAPSVVPALHSPHELCAISNRPLQQVPPTSELNHPAIEPLDAAAIFLWVYYEVLGDPAIDDPERPPIPDYARYSYPFVYSESEVFPVQPVYDWDHTRFVWRRVGRNLPPTAARPQPTALTVMIWEGVQAKANDLQAARTTVASIQTTDVT
jgi:hypothetical protein